MLIDWLAGDVLPALPAQAGLVSGLLFRSGLQAESTVEQRIRGHDAGIHWALLVTGYARSHVEALATGALRPSELERRGAAGVASATYELVHCLGQGDLTAGG
jgi:hypothetical protein